MNILIIGANGFTGRRILNDLVAREIYNITACSLRNDIKSGDGYQFILADIRNASEVRALFKEVCPDVVINTSALSVPDFCETHHNEARATNITAVEHLRVPANSMEVVLYTFPPILCLMAELTGCI